MKQISLASPQIGRSEIRAVNRVLRSRLLAQGPEVRNFESEFSNLVDGRECIAVNSGTSALHLCLLALGIGPGDEVLVPSFTFAATANVVSLVGAKPIFVDIEPRTYAIDPQKLRGMITPKTKALIAVHLYGLPANMTAIKQLTNESNIYLVEDAAQAHAASIDGKPVGTFGHAAAFSFYPTKNMTCGEGGMIVMENPDHAKHCRLLRNQGMEKRYQNEIVGFNLRMTDINASIGRVQLRKLEEMTEKRIRNAKFLNKSLATPLLPYTPDGFRHVFHQYTIRVPNRRAEVSKSLQSAGIGNDIYYPTPVHKLPSFDTNLTLPETEKAAREVLSLPVHPGLTRANLNSIANKVNKILNSYQLI